MARWGWSPYQLLCLHPGTTNSFARVAVWPAGRLSSLTVNVNTPNSFPVKPTKKSKKRLVLKTLDFVIGLQLSFKVSYKEVVYHMQQWIWNRSSDRYPVNNTDMATLISHKRPIYQPIITHLTPPVFLSLLTSCLQSLHLLQHSRLWFKTSAAVYGVYILNGHFNRLLLFFIVLCNVSSNHKLL